MSAEILELPDPRLYAVKVAAEVRAQAARKQVRGSQLAATLGISENAMSRRMTGKLPFGIDELAAVAAFLDVSVHDLLPHLDSNQKPAEITHSAGNPHVDPRQHDVSDMAAYRALRAREYRSGLQARTLSA